eukprot:5698488-Pyramimonas_sp.AAC.1
MAIQDNARVKERSWPGELTQTSLFSAYFSRTIAEPRGLGCEGDCRSQVRQLAGAEQPARRNNATSFPWKLTRSTSCSQCYWLTSVPSAACQREQRRARLSPPGEERPRPIGDEIHDVKTCLRLHRVFCHWLR